MIEFLLFYCLFFSLFCAYMLGVYIGVSTYGKQKKPKKCKHRCKEMVTLPSAVNCETTALKCISCNKIISKPKTDCR